ncbi:MAG: hypothetical protein IJJ26_10170 [Victivallales bacterium]|nr:hypothetical protein [Victivallales bacterium]
MGLTGEQERQEFIGTLDVTDELCDDGSNALSFTTTDGEEYIIRNRKMVRRLEKYAYEQSEVTIWGCVKHDPSGIDVLCVSEYDAPPIEDDYPQEERPRKRRRDYENDEDEEELEEGVHRILTPDEMEETPIHDDMEGASEEEMDAQAYAEAAEAEETDSEDSPWDFSSPNH